MARDRKLSVTITADASKAQKALGDFEKSAAKSGKRTESALSGVKGSLLDLGVASAGLFAFNEWNEAEKVAKQQEAVIKSTGNAANVSAAEMESLTAALSEKAAVDDELILSGANLLRTFTKVSDQAGEGNDVFSQGVETALDLSVALGTDMTSASMMLGKALNDPIKGLTTLGRAGVQFTADQKEQIRTLVETGDVLSAQKIILKELETQVGGSAEAQATGYDRAKVAAGNLAETVGGVLAPAVEGAAKVGQIGAEAFQGLDRWQQQAALTAGLAGYAYLRWGEQATEAILDVTNSSRNADDVLGKMNRTLGKGVAVGAAAFGAYALTYEALESMVDQGPDVEKLAAQLEKVGDGLYTIRDAVGDAGTDIDDVAASFKRLQEDTDGVIDAWQYANENIDYLGLEMRAAKNEVDAFDQALATLVQNGKADEAKVAFDALVESLMEQGLTYTEIVPKLDAYYDALEAGGKQNGIMSGAVGVLTDVLVDNEDAVESTRDSYEGLAVEIDKARQATADYFRDQSSQLNAEIAAEQALDDMTKALWENGETWNKNTQEGRDNLQALDQWKQSAVEAALGTDNAAASMHGYTMRLAESMMAAGMTKEEVDWLLASMGLTPDDIYTRFSSNADEEKEKVGGYIARIKEVPATWYTDFIARSGGNPIGGMLGFASGGRPPVGVPSIVGEEGPEVFIPDRPGTIVPNNRIGNVGGAVGSSMGGDTIVIPVSIGGRELETLIVDVQNRRVRREGRTGVNTTMSSVVR